MGCVVGRSSSVYTEPRPPPDPATIRFQQIEDEAGGVPLHGVAALSVAITPAVKRSALEREPSAVDVELQMRLASEQLVCAFLQLSTSRRCRGRSARLFV